MNQYWKYIVIGLLSLIAVFHISAIVYISGNRYELTSKDYYDREITYQQTIEKLRAGKAYQWNHRFDAESGQLELEVLDAAGNPVALTEPVMWLYRPNQANADREFRPKRGEDGIYRIAVASLATGLWKLTVEANHDQQPLAWRTRLVL
jgi:nitrogen fixation protein FixH